MFHISDIRHFLRCQRYFYLENSDHPHPRIISKLRSDTDIGELLKKRFNITELFVGQPNDRPGKFLGAVAMYDWFFNARIEVNNLRIKLPLLHRLKDGSFDIYFVVLLPNPMAGESMFYTQTVKMLQDLHFNISNISILHLNPDYIRGKQLNYDELLVISKHFYNENHLPKERIMWWINKRITDYSDTMLAMEECLVSDMPQRKEARNCLKRPKCDFFYFCYPNYHADDNPVANNQIEYAQKMTSETQQLFVDDLALKDWMSHHFKFPLAFIDFEWDTFAIPPYKGMKPLDVIPFQYSLDILEKNATKKHFDFLMTGDTRLAFLKSLLKNLPKHGDIVVFNAEGGEKLRLLDLKRQFPHYRKQIDKLIKRVIDISLPFNLGYIYLHDMHKAYSLKSIVKAINKSDYHGMEVSDGREAIIKWRLYEKQPTEKLRNSLIDYCRKDSQSLMEIYAYLREII